MEHICRLWSRFRGPGAASEAVESYVRLWCNLEGCRGFWTVGKVVEAKLRLAVAIEILDIKKFLQKKVALERL